MRRHGWTFGFGLLLGTAAAAQPPADLERYPPAPALPGQVVGQYGVRPVASAAKIPVKPTGLKLADPIAPPPPSMSEDPPPAYPAVVTATITTAPEVTPAPEPLPAPVAVAPMAGPAPIAMATDGGSCVSRLFDWICFRSRSRQSGHFPSPYCPPLQAWFKCEEKCNACAAPRVGPVITGVVEVVPTIPATITPAPATGKPASPPPPPAKPGLSAAPEPLPPGTVVASGPDLLPGFRQVDVGLSFAPGVAPINHPTSQVKRVSNWRPK